MKPVTLNRYQALEVSTHLYRTVIDYEQKAMLQRINCPNDECAGSVYQHEATKLRELIATCFPEAPLPPLPSVDDYLGLLKKEGKR